MPNRPAIPATVQRTVFVDAGHRCAVCGTPFPLERAHIVPWRVTQDHSAENLICLCANCHERADKEWDEKTLREYKRRPWVLRQNVTPEISSRRKRLAVTIDLELAGFDESTQRWLQYALASFLDISPETVQIESVEEGSVRVTIDLPENCANELLKAFRTDLSNIKRHVDPLVILNITDESAHRFDVFLSYASADRHIADELRFAIEEKGMSCFIDERSIPAGSSWEDEIREALVLSKELVVLLTPRSVGSDWISMEVGAAWALGKRITPILMHVDREALPSLMNRYQSHPIETRAQFTELVEQLSERQREPPKPADNRGTE